MNITLIAVHQDRSGNTNKFRLLDEDTNEVKDFPCDNVKNVLKSNKLKINGIELTGVKLKGSNGSFDRYPIFVDGVLSRNNKRITILATIDDIGYRVSDADGHVVEASTKALLDKRAEGLDVANGKIVEKNNTAFFSAINGSYKNVPVSQSPTGKKWLESKKIDKQPEQSKNSSEEIQKTRKKLIYNREKDPRLPRVITGIPRENSKLKEMDANTGMTVEQKLTAAMLAIQEIRPFYYSILSLLKRVEASDADGIDTMGASLDTLYFSSDFVKNISQSDLLFILLHEVCHIAMKHRIRENGREHDAWNYATDYFINKHLAEEFGLTEIGVPKKANLRAFSNSYSEHYISIPETGLFNDDVDVNKDTPETLYTELQQKIEQQGQQGQPQGQQGQPGSAEQQIAQNAQQIAQNMQQIQQGASNSNNQSAKQQIDNGIKQMQNGARQMNSGLQNSNNEQINQGAKQMQQGLEKVESGVEQLDNKGQQSNKQLEQSLKDMKNAVNDLKHNANKACNEKNEPKYNESNNGNDVASENANNKSGGTQSTSGNNTDSNDGTNSESNGNSEYNASQQRKEGRFAGKEFRGQEIPDIKPDMVDDNSTVGKTAEQLNQSTSSLLSQAVTIHKQRHSFGGDTADFLERYVEQALAPKVNWRSVLKRFLTKASQKEYTFAHPDKRFLGRVNRDGSRQVFAGPHMADGGELENIKICIDTSGSISPKDIGQALSQIEDMFKQYKADAELIYWDTRVRAVYPFKQYKELLSKEPMGGGGTDANCIFDFFDTNKDYKLHKKQAPSLVIIFTDGYFGDINTKYKRKYKNTVWIIHDNTSFKAPFGVKAALKNSID